VYGDVMTDAPRGRVRPTIRFLRDLDLSFPDLEQPLWGILHPLIVRMQRIPDEVAAGAGEPIRSLSDRLWWKCKTSELRGIVTRLTLAEAAARRLPGEAAWWAGAAGTRRNDSASDFYRLIEGEARRHGKGTGKPATSHLLPQQVDSERLAAEVAVLAVLATRRLVLDLVVRSFHDGRPHTAILSNHVVTALVCAQDGAEAYLAITAEGFIHPKMIAIILTAVPGVSSEDWQPEPGGVADIKPRSGQIIWSTLIPTEIQASILAHTDGRSSDG
jgi:hypothetical protein